MMKTGAEKAEDQHGEREQQQAAHLAAAFHAFAMGQLLLVWLLLIEDGHLGY